MADRMPIPDRFWSKVDRTPTCWIWTASRNADGYGQFGRTTQFQGRSILAHRLAYEALVGPVPVGMDLDHACHVRACVNPAHLQPQSHRLNEENRRGANKNSGTGVRGVSWNNKRQKYEVYATAGGVKHRVGYFSSLADATAAAIALRNRIMTNNLKDRAA